MSIPFPSFEVLRDRYFNDLRVKNWSEATIGRRHNSLGRFVRWLRARSIDSFAEVTVDSVNAYQRSLFHLGNLRTRKPLRFATQSSYLTAVAHWCQWACLNKFLPFNPAVGIELPKEEKRLASSYLSIVEVERLINRTDVTTHLGIRDRAQHPAKTFWSFVHENSSISLAVARLGGRWRDWSIGPFELGIFLLGIPFEG